MPWGAWATASATGVAAGLYAAAAVAAARRGRAHVAGRRAVPALFFCIAVFLALAALRQVAAALSVGAPGFTPVDLALFYVLLVPAASAIVPLVYLLASILSQNPRVPRAAALAISLPVAVGLFFAYLDGVEGPLRSAYGTDWHIVSPVTRLLLGVAILLPAVVGSAWLVWLARQQEGAAARRRILFVGASCLVYFTAFTLDALALQDLSLLAARLATAAAGLLAWRAYAGRAPVPAPAA